MLAAAEVPARLLSLLCRLSLLAPKISLSRVLHFRISVIPPWWLLKQHIDCGRQHKIGTRRRAGFRRLLQLTGCHTRRPMYPVAKQAAHDKSEGTRQSCPFQAANLSRLRAGTPPDRRGQCATPGSGDGGAERRRGCQCQEWNPPTASFHGWALQ